MSLLATLLFKIKIQTSINKISIKTRTKTHMSTKHPQKSEKRATARLHYPSPRLQEKLPSLSDSADPPWRRLDKRTRRRQESRCGKILRCSGHLTLSRKYVTARSYTGRCFVARGRNPTHIFRLSITRLCHRRCKCHSAKRKKTERVRNIPKVSLSLSFRREIERGRDWDFSTLFFLPPAFVFCERKRERDFVLSFRFFASLAYLAFLLVAYFLLFFYLVLVLSLSIFLSLSLCFLRVLLLLRAFVADNCGFSLPVLFGKSENRI